MMCKDLIPVFSATVRKAPKQIFKGGGGEGVRCPVSGVRCQVSGVRCQVSGVRCSVSGVRCPVFGVES